MHMPIETLYSQQSADRWYAYRADESVMRVGMGATKESALADMLKPGPKLVHNSGIKWIRAPQNANIPLTTELLSAICEFMGIPPDNMPDDWTNCTKEIGN